MLPNGAITDQCNEGRGDIEFVCQGTNVSGMTIWIAKLLAGTVDIRVMRCFAESFASPASFADFYNIHFCKFVHSMYRSHIAMSKSSCPILIFRQVFEVLKSWVVAALVYVIAFLSLRRRANESMGDQYMNKFVPCDSIFAKVNTQIASNYFWLHDAPDDFIRTSTWIINAPSKTHDSAKITNCIETFISDYMFPFFHALSPTVNYIMDSD